ncbi:MAG: hypothetical protein A3H97_13405 [Acidobacteria bacterium RIFCSPLOWO2_02_FULL_65_29]|nr:MAG: hypothetical protein A3H97_13405 [Acidobacteria bacterium RIFCSPLOWO2_02_FULL_65_29]
MAIVHFSSNLSQYTGGLETVSIEASRVGELLRALEQRFPDLSGHLESVAVAIDGVIYNDATYQSIPPDSEIHLLPPVSGG